MYFLLKMRIFQCHVSFQGWHLYPLPSIDPTNTHVPRPMPGKHLSVAFLSLGTPGACLTWRAHGKTLKVRMGRDIRVQCWEEGCATMGRSDVKWNYGYIITFFPIFWKIYSNWKNCTYSLFVEFSGDIFIETFLHESLSLEDFFLFFDYDRLISVCSS